MLSFEGLEKLCLPSDEPLLEAFFGSRQVEQMLSRWSDAKRPQTTMAMQLGNLEWICGQWKQQGQAYDRYNRTG